MGSVGRCQRRMWIAKCSSQARRCTCLSSPQSHPVIMAALSYRQRTPPYSSRNSMGLGSKTWTSFSVTLSGAEDDARVTRFDGRPRACLRRPSAPPPTGSFVHRRGAQSRTRGLTSSWASSLLPRETLRNLTCPQKMGFLVTGRKPSRRRPSWRSSTGAASQVA